MQKINLTRITDILSSIKQKFQRRENSQLYESTNYNQTVNSPEQNHLNARNENVDYSDPWRTL